MMEATRDIALPEGFAASVAPLLGDALPCFLAALDAPFVRGVRVRRGAPDIVPGGVLAPVPWQDGAFYLANDSLAGAHPLHEAGAYYIQEPSAMTPAAALCASPGERVLDLCAAPGGKSTQLAAMMRGEGVLVCNEPVPSRARVLSRNIERMGVPNAVVTNEYPDKLAERWRGYFDKVLVDAPCSGEGMFRRHPEARAEWRESQAAGCAARQAAILRSAAQMVRPGGMLAYSTCTFNALENEGVVEGFLREHGEFSLAPFTLPGLPAADGGMLRVWPHRDRGEGHFCALMRKSGGESAACAPEALPAPARDDAALCRAFLGDIGAPQPKALAVFSGRVIAPPADCPPLSGVRVLRVGLHLGASQSGRFVPDHALALGGAPQNTLPLSESDAARFLRGEELPVSDALQGWYAPAFCGFALGFGKASGGALKNHYPKGLRR